MRKVWMQGAKCSHKMHKLCKIMQNLPVHLAKHLILPVVHNVHNYAKYAKLWKIMQNSGINMHNYA